MKTSFATALALIAALSACATSPPSVHVAAVKSADAPALGVVHTAPQCGDDAGGFGAPTRHFGEPTPFSENPNNGCWPQ